MVSALDASRVLFRTNVVRYCLLMFSCKVQTFHGVCIYLTKVGWLIQLIGLCTGVILLCPEVSSIMRLVVVYKRNVRFVIYM